VQGIENTWPFSSRCLGEENNEPQEDGFMLFHENSVLFLPLLNLLYFQEQEKKSLKS